MRPLRCLVAALALPALTVAAGCNATQHEASLQDSFGGDVFAAFGGNQNGLNTPYVQGSKFTVTVEPGSNASASGWVLKSSDPTVMTVSEPSSTSGDWPVVAVGAGHATLSVYDASGKVIDSEGVDVDVPTTVQLCAQGLLISGYTDQQSQVSSIRMVSGGTATFLVRYFDGSQELYGNNALTPTGSGVATAKVVAANFSVRDFLEVSAPEMGSASVTLAVAQGQTQVPVEQVPVEIVDPSEVASVALAKQDDSKATKGQTLYVFGRAADSQGNDLFGASFAWTVNGATLPTQVAILGGPADMLTYQYDPSTSESIGDTLDSHGAISTVHGGPATTALASTENVGCSIGRGAGAGGAGAAGAGMFAAAVALLVSRRRRATSQHRGLGGGSLLALPATRDRRPVRGGLGGGSLAVVPAKGVIMGGEARVRPADVDV